MGTSIEASQIPALDELTTLPIGCGTIEQWGERNLYLCVGLEEIAAPIGGLTFSMMRCDELAGRAGGEISVLNMIIETKERVLSNREVSGPSEYIQRHQGSVGIHAGLTFLLEGAKIVVGETLDTNGKHESFTAGLLELPDDVTAGYNWDLKKTRRKRLPTAPYIGHNACSHLKTNPEGRSKVRGLFVRYRYNC